MTTGEGGRSPCPDRVTSHKPSAQIHCSQHLLLAATWSTALSRGGCVVFGDVLCILRFLDVCFHID